MAAEPQQGGDLPAPLVPAEVDLTDFKFMPFEFGRLFQSETWILSDDSEKVAAITLWGKSWAEVPAGSLPSDERLLAHLSGAGMTRWRKVREMALRGWVAANDGRYYHPVVCEKALEAWLEKLHRRISSGHGNAAKHGSDFDPAPIVSSVETARTMLAALNPESKALKKRPPKSLPAGEKKSPGGNPGGSPGAAPMGSQETGTGTETGTDQKQKISTPDGVDPAEGSAAPAQAGELGETDLLGAAPAKGPPPCPHDAIVALYHEVLPELTHMRDWSADRQKLLRARWREDTNRQSLDWWRGYFEYVRKCPFLMGEIDPAPGRQRFYADLEWLIRPVNFRKVREGKYEADL